MNGEVNEVKNEVSELDAVNINSVGEATSYLRNNLKLVLLIATLVAVAYGNSLAGEFVSDDLSGILHDPSLKNLTSFLNGHVLTLPFVTYFLTLKLFGPTPIPFHVISVTAHMLTAILAFVLFTQLYGKKVATIAAAIFAVHPVGTEAVSWISGLSYIFFGLETAIILIAYNMWAITRQRKYLVAAFLTYLISTFLLIRTEWHVIIPFFLMLADLLQSRKTRGSIVIHLCFLVVSVVFATSLIPRSEYRATLVTPQAQAIPYLLRISYSAIENLKLYTFPLTLTFYHDANYVSERAGIIYQALFAAVVTATTILVLKNKREGVLLAMIFTSTALLFTPTQFGWVVAERYLYTGTLFYSLLIAAAIVKLENFLTKRQLLNKHQFAYVCAGTIVILFTARTIVRNIDWSSQKNLWAATVKTNPGSAKAHNNLGRAYMGRGDFRSAIRELKVSYDLNNSYADPLYNLGTIHLLSNNLDFAQKSYEAALTLKPTMYEAYVQLALVELKRGDKGKATEYINKAKEMSPTDTRVNEILNRVQSAK